ncbi:hypothetical protein JCM5296_004913 [Sporobolomyces johnsonii]
MPLLTVKASLGDRGLPRRVSFPQAHQVEWQHLPRPLPQLAQSFALQPGSFRIAYRDDDNDSIELCTTSDLSEAIDYFSPSSSSSSCDASEPHRITLKLVLLVDYSGPALSDAGSSVYSLSSREGRSSSRGSMVESSSGYGDGSWASSSAPGGRTRSGGTSWSERLSLTLGLRSAPSTEEGRGGSDADDDDEYDWDRRTISSVVASVPSSRPPSRPPLAGPSQWPSDDDQWPARRQHSPYTAYNPVYPPPPHPYAYPRAFHPSDGPSPPPPFPPWPYAGYPYPLPPPPPPPPPAAPYSAPPILSSTSPGRPHSAPSLSVSSSSISTHARRTPDLIGDTSSNYTVTSSSSSAAASARTSTDTDADAGGSGSGSGGSESDSSSAWTWARPMGEQPTFEEESEPSSGRPRVGDLCGGCGKEVEEGEEQWICEDCEREEGREPSRTRYTLCGECVKEGKGEEHARDEEKKLSSVNLATPSSSQYHRFIKFDGAASPSPTSSSPLLESPPDPRPRSITSGSGSSALGHGGIACISCRKEIVGPRYTCAVCSDVDFCSTCERLPLSLTSGPTFSTTHTPSHILLKLPSSSSSSSVSSSSLRSARDRARTIATSTSSQEGQQPWSREAWEEWYRSLPMPPFYPPLPVQHYSHPFHTHGHPDPHHHSYHHPLHHPRHHHPHHSPPLHTAFSPPPAAASLPPKPSFGRLHFGGGHGVSCRACGKVVPGAEDRWVCANCPTMPSWDLVICDACVQPIRGAWLRCCHCADSFDICSQCLPRASSTHPPSHVFVKLVRKVDLELLREVSGLRSGRPRALLEFRVYD